MFIKFYNFIDQALFSEGFRPAIDIAKSVSRIGGKAQQRRIKEEAGRIKLDYLQFLELEIFTRFGARVEATMEKRIHRGQILRELLKQDRLKPLPVEFQLAWLQAFNEGLFDRFEIEEIQPQIKQLEQHLLHNPLGLNDDRDSWIAALRGWLGSAP